MSDVGSPAAAGINGLPAELRVKIAEYALAYDNGITFDYGQDSSGRAMGRFRSQDQHPEPFNALCLVSRQWWEDTKLVPYEVNPIVIRLYLTGWGHLWDYYHRGRKLATTRLYTNDDFIRAAWPLHILSSKTAASHTKKLTTYQVHLNTDSDVHGSFMSITLFWLTVIDAFTLGKQRSKFSLIIDHWDGMSSFGQQLTDYLKSGNDLEEAMPQIEKERNHATQRNWRLFPPQLSDKDFDKLKGIASPDMLLRVRQWYKDGI